MIGTFLEYFNVPCASSALFALSEFNLRYLPGLEIRMLSGFLPLRRTSWDGTRRR